MGIIIIPNMKKNVQKKNFLNKKTQRENTNAKPTKTIDTPEYSEDDEDIDSMGNNSYQSENESENENQLNNGSDSDSNNEINNEESELDSEISAVEKTTKKENKNIELSLEEANNIKK